MKSTGLLFLELHGFLDRLYGFLSIRIRPWALYGYVEELLR